MNWTAFERLTRFASLLFAVGGLIYLILPVLILAPLSLSSGLFLDLPLPGLSMQWYSRMWNHPGYLASFSNTLMIGIGVAVLSVLLGTMAGLAIVRGRMPFGRALSGLILSPLIMPQIILAIGIFPILARFDLIGSRAAVIVAHTAVATPLVFVTVSAALRGYSQNMDLAAMTLGANGWRTFWHVTFPMIRLGMLTGAIFAFAFSFDEIIIALFLTDASSVTLPVFIWNELRYQMDPTIAAASTVAIVLALGLLGVATLLQRQSAKVSTSKEPDA
ncbi:ABC transporter permease [Mesorhizobium sp. B3-1-3]|uniref:ABC transporter permease n=1 Tax=unclassified Mesorhizobium TaxID=325217 RepID=UPI00112B90E5|nr:MULTISPECIES: ABC transporter permease [unclassified Mesorhizobium]TPI57351.1 ABC transporter permease [Mesorhizobium sp. B3-1-8]TPI63504.1 ABC transporter permease [Mesorhizobium sp. B3-1-3]